MPDTAVPAWARAVAAGLRSAGSRDVVYVPDSPLSHVLDALEEAEDVRLTLATREEEAFGIAAGLYLGGRRPGVLLQSSGLGNSLNAISSLLMPYQIPALILISVRGWMGEWNAAQVPMGRALRSILEALAVPHVVVEHAEAAERVVSIAGDLAFGTRTPAACLLPRALTAPPGAVEAR